VLKALMYDERHLHVPPFPYTHAYMWVHEKDLDMQGTGYFYHTYFSIENLLKSTSPSGEVIRSKV
jgi:hypothetical protein